MDNRRIITRSVTALLVVLLVVLFLVSYASAGKEYITTSQSREMVDDGIFHYENIVITWEKQMPKDIPEQIRKAVVKLPVEVIQKFVDEEWKISIVSAIEMPDDANIGVVVDDTDTIIGVTDYNTKVIQVLYSNDQSSITMPVMHELCHYGDKYYGEKYCNDPGLYEEEPSVYLVSFTKQFDTLYQAHRDYVEYEKSGLTKTVENMMDYIYPVSTSSEFMACTMKDYFLYPKYLKANYKEIYEFYENLLHPEN